MGLLWIFLIYFVYLKKYIDEANDEWILERRNNKLPKKLIINTYKDHRIAMSFASLSSKLELVIRDPKVVNKSYPNFWNDLESIGYVCKKTI